MDWWNNALQAAEKGLQRAKEMGKKGLVSVAWGASWPLPARCGYGSLRPRCGSCGGPEQPPALASVAAPSRRCRFALLLPPFATRYSCVGAYVSHEQEVVEATAEEANRKLQLNLHDKVGAGGKAPPPSQAELEAFGLTQEFADWVHTLNYRWAQWGVVELLLLLAGCLLHVSAVLLGGMHIAGRFALNCTAVSTPLCSTQCVPRVPSRPPATGERRGRR